MNRPNMDSGRRAGNHIGDTFTNMLPRRISTRRTQAAGEQGSIGASYIDGIKTGIRSNRRQHPHPAQTWSEEYPKAPYCRWAKAIRWVTTDSVIRSGYSKPRMSQSYTVRSDNPYMAFVILVQNR